MLFASHSSSFIVRLEALASPPRIDTWVQTYQLARSLVEAGQGLALVDPLTALHGGGQSIQARPLEPQVPVPLYALVRAQEAAPAAQLELTAAQHSPGPSPPLPAMAAR